MICHASPYPGESNSFQSRLSLLITESGKSTVPEEQKPDCSHEDGLFDRPDQVKVALLKLEVQITFDFTLFIHEIDLPSVDHVLLELQRRAC